MRPCIRFCVGGWEGNLELDSGKFPKRCLKDKAVILFLSHLGFHWVVATRGVVELQLRSVGDFQASVALGELG